MTGKEFKEFAGRVGDDATVEFDDGSTYNQFWKPLDASKIRAVTLAVVKPHVNPPDAEETIG